MFKVIELFSGIGAQAKALSKIGVNFKIVATVDWDIYSIISYSIIHHYANFNKLYKKWLTKFDVHHRTQLRERERERERERLISKLEKYNFSRNGKINLNSLNGFDSNFLKALEISIEISNNLIDIKTVNTKILEKVDLITYSFPCQDLSLQGKQKGLKKGKFSSLLWEVKRILTDLKNENKLPKFLLMENVAAIFNNSNSKNLKEWTNFLTYLGYENKSFKLNSKYFNIPQNRERAFIISSLSKFKTKIEFVSNNKLTTKTIKNILLNSFNNREYEWKLPNGSVNTWNPAKNKNGISLTKINNYTSFGSEACAFSTLSISPTITATGARSRIKIILNDKNGYYLRMLQPIELFKLMGFSERDFKRISSFNLIPKLNLIKQAGNSIVVNVLVEIFKKILVEHHV